jgi:glutathione S-transferase
MLKIWGRANSINKLAASMAILDAHLTNRKYVIGDAFTTGDIPLGTAVQRWFNLPIERDNLRNLEACYRRLQARAPFRQCVDLLPLS